MGYILLFILIRDKQEKIVKKQLVITERPDRYLYEEHLGRLRWLSNNEVQFLNKDNNMKWNVRL